MSADDFNYLNPEDRRRPNESNLFARTADELERLTKLNGLEARGTLAIALKISGHLTRNVGLSELTHTIHSVLPGELRARGVKDERNVCADLLSRIDPSATTNP